MITAGLETVQQLLGELTKQTLLTAHMTENTAIAAYYTEVATNNAKTCALIGVANYINIWEHQRQIGSKYIL